MKKKAKVTLVATTFMILSLTIITPRTIPQEHPQIPKVRPVSALVNSSRDNNQPLHDKAVVSNKCPEISTQSEDLPTQATEKEKTVTAPTPTTQTATKPTTPPAPISIEPKNGDTRIVDGKQEGYLLGFGWVDYMGENEVIYCEDMYENGNKVGIMD